jgi:5'-nucleotidase
VVVDIKQKLVVAVSSRALFDLAESHGIFEADGVEAYSQHQVDNENRPLETGAAFSMVKKLLAMNSIESDNDRVEVILLSKNSTDTGLRIFKSIQHHGLEITRAAFTTGGSPYQYAAAFGAHLFLSMDPTDVRMALDSGVAAATIMPGRPKDQTGDKDQLRIAFDGDSVLFSDDAERVFQEEGLKAFEATEISSANTPLPGGPFKPFLAGLCHLQSEFPRESSPIRTALVTARGAPAHERVMRTLRAWNIRIDEALFLGGMGKAEFLRAFKADIFFDDQRKHCDSAKDYVATGHVPDGVMNKKS